MSQKKTNEFKDLSKFVRNEINLTPISNDEGAGASSTNLIILDTNGILDAHSAVDIEEVNNLLKQSYATLVKGGTLVVLVDLWTITKTSEALEAAGFKQLRYIQAVSPCSMRDDSLYPENNRLMAITAVKSGGSTFNSVYNNGHFSSPSVEENPQTLLKEIIANHTNPSYIVGVRDPSIQALLIDLQVELREKPVPPKKKTA